MAANTDPIYSRAPDVQSSGLITTAPSSLYNGDGATIGTNMYLVWSADPTNGGFLQRLRIKYVANAATASNPCVMKIFMSSTNSGSTTIANTKLIDEVSLPSITPGTTAALTSYEVTMNIPVPPGMHILASLTVSQAANTGYIVTGIGGKY